MDYDNVAIVNSDLLLEEGDLVVQENESKKRIILILGKNVSFIERYTRNRNLPSKNVSVYKNFFATKTLEIIHWMVSERYTTYRKIISLYFSKKQKENIDLYTKTITANQKHFQHLFLFPDLRTLRNTVSKKEIENKNNIVLTNNLSLNAHIMAIDNIRCGVIKNIYTTKSEIFQDRRNLKEITIFDHHKRYYGSQQDPRYKVTNVIEKMKETYKICVNYR